MSMQSDIDAFKKKIDEGQRLGDQAKGVREQILGELKEHFDISSLPEAKELLQTEMTAVEKTEDSLRLEIADVKESSKWEL